MFTMGERERERWMMAVQARLKRVTTTQDMKLVLKRAARTEARKLARTITDDPGSLQAMHLLGWLHWYRYQALPEGSGQQDLQVAVTMLTPCFIDGISELPPSLLPFLADEAIPVAEKRVDQLELRYGDPGFLTATADLWRRILAATPADHPSRAIRMSNLGYTLTARFERTGATADLDNAIETMRQAVQATSPDHPNHTIHLSSLGTALATRFGRTGTTPDIDAAITYLRDVVQTTPPDHPDLCTRLTNLGTALRARFEHTGAMADLDAAIATTQHGIQVTPADHPYRGMVLSNLGSALEIRFERTGATSDLDAGINYLRDAISVTPPDHRQLGMRLANLGAALANRFKLTGAIPDIDAAIARFRDAIQATPAEHSDRAMHVSNLGGALQLRFKSTGVMADLDAAIGVHQEAIQDTPIDHPDRAVSPVQPRDRTESQVRAHRGCRGPRHRIPDVYGGGEHRGGSDVGAHPSEPCCGVAGGGNEIPGVRPVCSRRRCCCCPKSLRGSWSGAINSMRSAGSPGWLPMRPQRRCPTRPSPSRSGLRGRCGCWKPPGESCSARPSAPAVTCRNCVSDTRSWPRGSPSCATGSIGPHQSPARPGGWPGDREAGPCGRRRDRREADAEFTRLLAHIRGLDGFATFALPPTAEQLEAQAEAGTRGGPQCQPLTAATRSCSPAAASPASPCPAWTQASVVEPDQRLLPGPGHDRRCRITLWTGSAPRRRSGRCWPGCGTTLPDRSCTPSATTEPPSPGQPMAAAVVGARRAAEPAAHPRRRPSRQPARPRCRTVMDRVISSYTPTVGALAHARTPRTAAPPGASHRSLIVAMPTTPDLPHDGRLTYVPAEAALLQAPPPSPHAAHRTSRWPRHHGRTGPHQGRRAGAPARLRHRPLRLPRPHRSRRSLSKPPPAPRPPPRPAHRRRAGPPRPRPRPAGLPIGLQHRPHDDSRLLDEAIHLASAFQLVGFPHVIGTLWEINDAIALEDRRQLLHRSRRPDGTLDLDRAASSPPPRCPRPARSAPCQPLPMGQPHSRRRLTRRQVDRAPGDAYDFLDTSKPVAATPRPKSPRANTGAEVPQQAESSMTIELVDQAVYREGDRTRVPTRLAVHAHEVIGVLIRRHRGDRRDTEDRTRLPTA